MTDEALRRLSPRFDTIYAATGRPSIPPEHLWRALLLRVTVRQPPCILRVAIRNDVFAFRMLLNGTRKSVKATTTEALLLLRPARGL